MKFGSFVVYLCVHLNVLKDRVVFLVKRHIFKMAATTSARHSLLAGCPRDVISSLYALFLIRAEYQVVSEQRQKQNTKAYRHVQTSQLSVVKAVPSNDRASDARVA